MKIFLNTLLCVSLASSVIAQKAPVKFGEVPPEDLKMTTYALDSSASAVVLTDFGEAQLVYSQSTGFSLLFERILRIKILKKDGLDWATISVPLYHNGADDEKLVGLKATTYNLDNGKMVETKMKNDAVFTEKLNENINITKFTLPNVKEGSVIDVSYKITSDLVFHFQDWDFQRSVPTRHSEYRARIPEFYHYEMYMHGYVPLAAVEHNTMGKQLTLTSRNGGAQAGTIDYNQISYVENQYRWVAKSVPAFKPEPYMTTARDYISRINFELSYQKFPNQPIKPIMGTWADINKQFYESSNFGGEVRGNGFLKKITEEVIAGKTTAEEKIAAINTYVKRNMEWDGRSYKFSQMSLKTALEQKKGSSAEINLLLASMLDKAGMKVSPVLISTRDNGFVREASAISTQFNYIICLVNLDDKAILLDATDPLLATGVLPQRCLNGQGLVISKDNHSWIPLATKNRSRDVYNADLKLTDNGELNGDIRVDHAGYFARDCRKTFAAKGKEGYLKDFISTHPWEFENSEFINTHEVAEPFKEIHKVTISDHLNGSSDVIYLNPFLSLQEKENPFKSQTREYPVDFGSPIEKLYMCKIILPPNYVVDEVPAPRILKLNDNAAKYTYSLTQSGNTLSLISHLQINNSLFAQTDYEQLREFYAIMVAKQAEQIVLKKK